MDILIALLIFFLPTLVAIFLGIKFFKQKNDLKRYKGITDVEDEIYRKKKEFDSETENNIKERNRQQKVIDELKEKYSKALIVYDELVKEIRLYKDDLEDISFGVYTPIFDYSTSEIFKEKIKQNIDKQKLLIKEKKAAISKVEWTVEGSKHKGKAMTNRYIKLTLRAFNGDCDTLISKVNWNNVFKIEERIKNDFIAINKLGDSNQVFITQEFLDLKLLQLKLVYEYELKKYEEKEEQRRIREEMREEEKARKEIEKAQKMAEEEEVRYEKALEKARGEMEKATGKKLDSLKEKMLKLEQELKEAKENKERALSRAQLTKSGHVYIISNIGSFGENVYKIGMTRRLEPLDRVRELGDASVPFLFDVHAMIYSDNAPELENALHKEFDDKKVNMVNHRREFFNISLDDIQYVVKKNFNAEVKFTKLAEAKEYRETISIREKLLKQGENVDKEQSKFPQDIFDN